jgi:hypothetical protein
MEAAKPARVCLRGRKWYDGQTLKDRLIIYAVRLLVILAAVGVGHISVELFSGSGKGCAEEHCEPEQ